MTYGLKGSTGGGQRYEILFSRMSLMEAPLSSFNRLEALIYLKMDDFFQPFDLYYDLLCYGTT